MVVTIIGTGLIGGSMALVLKQKQWATRIIGVDTNEVHQAKAVSLGLVDVVMEVPEAIAQSDLVIVATPVDIAEKLLPQLLDIIHHQIVLDVGSTKMGICSLVTAHPKRNHFVATHPMWGTEYSGPDAATTDAFSGKAVVICNREESSAVAIEQVESLYQTLGMHRVYMSANDHDVHVAYVSHISHITSFALANTVLEKEREEETIFELASGGFESTVRLAKSNPAMWEPILMQNRENILDVLNELITQLRRFKSSLEKENTNYLSELIQQANGIKRILK